MLALILGDALLAERLGGAEHPAVREEVEVVGHVISFLVFGIFLSLSDCSIAQLPGFVNTFFAFFLKILQVFH